MFMKCFAVLLSLAASMEGSLLPADTPEVAQAKAAHLAAYARVAAALAAQQPSSPDSPLLSQAPASSIYFLPSPTAQIDLRYAGTSVAPVGVPYLDLYKALTEYQSYHVEPQNYPAPHIVPAVRAPSWLSPVFLFN